MRSSMRGVAAGAFAFLVLVIGAWPASAGFPLPLAETLEIVPDDSELSFDLLLTQTTNRTAGTVGVGYDVPGTPGVAGILNLSGFLLDPVDEVIDFGGGAVLTLTAPAESIFISAAAAGITANGTTPIGGGAFTFDQNTLDLDLSGVITLSDGETSAPIDLATVGTLTNQSILGATLAFDGNGTTLDAPIDVMFDLPLGNDGFLPVHVTGTIRAVTAGDLAGDYNGSGQVEQADLDFVLQNWGQNTPPVPDGWTNDLPDGLIDQGELDGVLLNWGNTAAPGSTSSASVPEPATAWGALFIWLALHPRRRALDFS